MDSNRTFRHFLKCICIALLAVVLAACSTELVPEVPEALEPDLQTEAVANRSEMIRRAEEWIGKVDYRDPNRLAQPWGYRQDCSGYIDYIWGVGKRNEIWEQPNTTELSTKKYSYGISKNELLPGDVLNRPRTSSTSYNGHIILFAEWTNKGAGKFLAYEVRNSGGAVKSVKDVDDLINHYGYTPMRSNALKGHSHSIYDPQVFNWLYYLELHTDLRPAGIRTEAQARNHWRYFGIKEGRRGSNNFHSRIYYNRYEDLRRAFTGEDQNYQLIKHYLIHGIGEGRSGR